MSGYYPPVLPPDIEWLSSAFLTPFLAALPGFDNAVPVVTKLPPPADLQATLTGIMRVEAGDTHWMDSLYGAAFDVSFLMHAYSPNEDQAAMIHQQAFAQVIAAAGQTITGWYVVKVCNAIGGRRLVDPDVPENIVRYRSAVTWRVAGQPLS